MIIELLYLLCIILTIVLMVIIHKCIKFYKVMVNGNNKNLTYIDRIINEHKELIAKIEKLEDFLNSTKNSNIINPYQREMLNKQLFYMKEYANVLNIRIEYETNIDKIKKEKIN